MSRASSGFESSHLLPPASPESHPSTSTSTGNGVENPDPPCSAALGGLPVQSIDLLSGPAVSRVPSGAVSRSLSCSELRGDAACQPLRRSLSLNLLCKDQKSVNIHLKNQSASSPVKTEGSTQGSGDVHDDHQVVSLSSSQPPATQRGALQDSGKATHSGDKDAARTRGPLQPAPDVSWGRSDLPPLTAPILNPHMDALPTEAVSVRLTNRVVSANIEARRLKMKRDKEISVSVCSPAEEKL